MSLLIRPAEMDDLAEITRIYAHAVDHETASFELDPPDLAEMVRRYETLVSDGYPYLVAELQNRLAGYAYVGPYRPRPAYRWTVENSIYLAPDMRGKGFGGHLLAELIARCEHLGFRQMIAVLGGADFERSRQLHHAHDFREVGQLEAVGRKHHAWHDILIMQRALGEGASNPPHPGDGAVDRA
ncbi:GNAT family N-acetyltransferase [Coralliovum pocilloporae]|uniref:GNAT family N-acetyltransferase n=1 Tax=Coralliovum pocilloporae TaxID=3066369 RepID=UPI00330707A9